MAGMRRLALLLCLAGACGGEDAPAPAREGIAALELNDLSILLPPGEDAWLAIDTPARGGLLVPPALIDAVRTEVGLPDEPFDVVAIRVDPCFRGLSGDVCQPQLRLVLQAGLADTAFHALYRLTEAELDDWVGLLVELRTGMATADAVPRPLGEHDIISRQGREGAFARAIRERLLELCGAETIVRLTHSAFDASVAAGFKWRFTGVDASGQHLDILGFDEQGLVVFVSGFGWLVDIGLADDELPMLAPIDEQPASAALAQAVYRVEDPRRSLPDEVTCVACHVAGPVRRAFQARWPEDAWPDDGYASTHPVDELLPDQTGPGMGSAFRMFGRFNGQPAVTLRVARETADVKDALLAR
jgi:hypothetical protein